MSFNTIDFFIYVFLVGKSYKNILFSLKLNAQKKYDFKNRIMIDFLHYQKTLLKYLNDL